MTQRISHENEGISGQLLGLLAIIAGVSVANLYYNQPLLGMIARDFKVSEFAVNQISMYTQIGYAVGLLFLIPLGDMWNRRTILKIDFIILTLALLIMAWGENFSIILIASFIIGTCSVIPQIFVPIASQLSTPESKGRNIGIVISGLLIGILASRVISGIVGEHWGWRMMYFIASGLMITCMWAVMRWLPDLPSTFQGRYTQLMSSLLLLVRKYPLLRVAALRAALGFGSFLSLWTTLSFHMEQPPFCVGSDVTGLLGLCGICGALTASFVGRYVKQIGENLFNTIGYLLFFLAWVIFMIYGNTYTGMIIGIILIDIAMQCLQLSNQVIIFSLSPNASNRLNTIFMTTYFLGGALGTFSAGAAWSTFGWNGVIGTGIIFISASLLFHIKTCYKKYKKNK